MKRGDPNLYLLDFSSSLAAWAALSRADESNLYASIWEFLVPWFWPPSWFWPPDAGGVGGGGKLTSPGGGFCLIPNNQDIFQGKIYPITLRVRDYRQHHEGYEERERVKGDWQGWWSKCEENGTVSSAIMDFISKELYGHNLKQCILRRHMFYAPGIGNNNTINKSTSCKVSLFLCVSWLHSISQ